jgi:tetraacyldisaccharide 4'-kinase
VRAPWLEADRRRSAWALPLAPVSLAWAAGAWLHRGVYRFGWKRRMRLPLRVVSVGSLVVGGAGKTPAAAWIAGALLARGHKVVLASRGHGRRGRGEVVVVSDGRFVRSLASAAGDEPMVLAARAPGVPVLVGRDRVRLGWRALSAFSADVLVLDDGFQHHRLHRDVDLVVFDGAIGFGAGGCLPWGALREPAHGLARADAIGVVDGPLAPQAEARLERLAPRAFRFAARRRPVSVRPLAGGSAAPPEWLAGRAVGVFSGLAQPASLRRGVEALGAEVVAELRFGDHHRYRPADLAGLAAQAPVWITTEKDAIKIPAAWARSADVRVLAIELAVEEPDRLLGWLDARLR